MKAVALFLCALLVAVFADSCQDNCLSPKCQTCFCGVQVAVRDPASVCQKFSEWDQEECECVARVASGSNSNAISMNEDGTVSVGLFQINSAMWGSCSGGAAPCGIEQNLACAIEMFREGGNTFSMFPNALACESLGATSTTNGTNHTTTHHPTHTSGTHATHTSTHASHTSGTHGPSTHGGSTHGPSTHGSHTSTHGPSTHGGPSGPSTHGGPSGPSASSSGGPSGPSGPSTHSSHGPSSHSSHGPSSTHGSSSSTQTTSTTYGGFGIEEREGGAGRLGKITAVEGIVKGGKIGLRADDQSAKKFDF